MRRLASACSLWLGIAVALTTTGCGLLIDTSPPDVLPDAAASADGGASDGADRDANVQVDAGDGDGGSTLADADSVDADAVDANVDVDAGAPDLGPICADADGDGLTDCAGDCNDADPLSALGLPEICGDSADNDCDGAADEGCVPGIGTFVSALTGSDTNPGTRALPVQTIGRGIVNATTLGLPQTVVVAEGTYREKVVLVHNLQLLGGYQCPAGGPAACSWARDPLSYVSTIENTDFEGVLAPAGVTRTTLLEGFRILGRSGTAPAPGSAGITLLGGSPIIRANVIVGGNVSGGAFTADRSIGVHLRSTTDSAGALLAGNDIRGGMSSNLSVAVLFDSYPLTTTALATVQRNVLRGGTAVRSVGLTAWNQVPGTLVQNNEIITGNSVNGTSHGIEVGGPLTIDGNRINVDRVRTGVCTTPTGWCAGIMSESSTTTITNNVIFGAIGPRSAAVHLGEFEVPAGAVILNGNLLDGGGGGGVVGSTTRSAALVVTIGSCTGCGFRGFVGRVRNNILRGGSNVTRFGVLEEPSTGRSMRPEVLENNDFYFVGASTVSDVLYRQLSASGVITDHTDVATINVLIAPLAGANIEEDPLVDATWHTMPGSPCIDQGTSVEAPTTDFEGDARPAGAGFDIGPDET